MRVIEATAQAKKSASRDILTDKKLVAKVKRLARAEYAGYIRYGHGGENLCVEPGCSCCAGWPEDGDPVCGLFRNIPVRCTGFEIGVLGLNPNVLRKEPWDPIDPDLAEAYRHHLLSGAELETRRCRWPGCRKQIMVSRNTQYCELHRELARRRSQRERFRRHKGSKAG